MKNIHVLPTDKPSRLFIIDKSKMFKPEAPYLSFSTVGGKVHKVEGSELYQPQNMYITSDEEVKEPCWCVNTIKNTWNKDIIYYQGAMPAYHFVGFKKIVLTTDPLLIEQGVQKIDDEFLEWFIKNSDCEFVEIEKIYRKERNDTGMIGSPMSFTVFDKYKINIPKANIIDTWLEKNSDPVIEKHVELELAANEYANLVNDEDGTSDIDFIEGANWMAERMYSEENCYKTLHNLMTDIKLQGVTINDDTDLKRWFENNKR